MIRKLARYALILTVSLAGWSASTAYAGPLRLRVENVTTGKGVVLTDNGSGDLNGALGIVVFQGAFDGFTFNVTTGLSQPVIGTFNALDLNSVDVYNGSGGPGSLRITLEDSGYTGGPNGLMQNMAGVGGTLNGPGASVTFRAWANPNDLAPDLGPDVSAPAILGTPIGPIPGGSVEAWGGSGVTFGPGAFSGTDSGVFTKTGAYSLFNQAEISFVGNGFVSFDLEQTAVVPEPTSLLLVGSALVGASLRRRMRS